MLLISLIVKTICIIYLLFSGPIVVSGIFLTLLQVLGIFTIIWTIWTVKVDKFFLSFDLPKNHRFVAKGIYKIIRYPLFTSILLISTSLIINYFTITRLAVWLILISFSVFYLFYKDKLLSKSYNDYSLYKQKTYRAIPFLF